MSSKEISLGIIGDRLIDPKEWTKVPVPVPRNNYIDKVLEEALTKLKVSVRVDDVDWKKILDMFDKQHEWMTTQMQKHIREVNQMFYEERRRVQERYKEYDGTYLGHYVQYFFWFFFVLGLVIFGLAIFLMLDSHYYWTK